MVTENTPHCHKLTSFKKGMSFHSKGHIFHLKHCVYFPILVRIFVGTLDSCFLTHRKNNTTSIHVTLFKNMSKCVFISIHINLKLLTDSVNKVHFWGSMYSTKELAGRSFFYNTGSQSPGHVSPGGSLRAAPSTFLFWRFKAHK